jgi:hypothetical protein
MAAGFDSGLRTAQEHEPIHAAAGDVHPSSNANPDPGGSSGSESKPDTEGNGNTKEKMIIAIPLQPGTVLANVRFYWIVGGVQQATQSSGITQPDGTFPLFLFSVVPPVGADEIVAFDNTDPANWNNGQYDVIALGPPAAPAVVVTVPTPAPPWLRTTKFQSVYESILRRHGLDPLVSTEHDVLRAVNEHINNRIETAWGYWEWPQLTLLQERAFRTIWTSTTQFYKVNTEGKADELYYGVDTLYYRVKASAPTNPPVGTVPTNTIYFETFSLSDRYILMDQPNQTPIGEAITVFDTDPRINQYHYASKIPFRPNEREISITWAGTGPTVWLFFKIPASEFTMIPYMTGKAYAQGDAVFHSGDGECYQANQANPTGDPTAQPLQWTKVPFPSIFRRYVAAGAYADGLAETDPSENDPVKLQIRNTKAQMAEKEATDFIQQEIDGLIQQGQVYRYGEFNPVRWWRSHSRYW